MRFISVKLDYKYGVWPWNTNIWDSRIQKKKEAMMGEEHKHQVGDEQIYMIVQLPFRNAGLDSSWLLFDIKCQLKGVILKMHIATWCWGGTHLPLSYPVFSVAHELGPGTNMKPKASPKWSWINLCTWAYWESSNICFPSCVRLLFGLISCGKRKRRHLYASNVQIYKSFPAEAVANFGISCFAH